MLRGIFPRAALALLAVVAIVVGCATNPVTGKRQFSLVSSDQELRIGREGHDAVLKEYGVYDDARLAAYVDSVGQSLARVSHLPQLQWHFTVLDDPAVNAFALPGGYIYITRGILAHLNSEAQLAGVLGHEIGHVTARHSAQRLTSQQLAGLGLGLASVFSETFRQYSSAAEQALGLLLLKYSRDNETEADGLGVDYATRAGYDPREIPATYHTLQRVGERAGQRLPGFLSTHPDPGNREVRTRALAQQAAAGKTGLKVAGRGYLASLQGVVYGHDPRQGYFEDARFYHPALDFEITFPSQWRTQNTQSAVLAANQDQSAAMQLTLVDTKGATPGAFVDQLVTSGKVAAARGRSEKIGGFSAWTGRLVVANADGSQGALVAAFVQRSAEQTFQMLGRSAASGDADEERILTSARSFRPIADAARRNPTPDRVNLVTVSLGGPFQDVVAKLGPQAIEAEETSILNNVALDEDVRKGELLKIVKPGTRR